LGPPDVAGEAEVDMTKENFDMLQVLEFIWRQRLQWDVLRVSYWAPLALFAIGFAITGNIQDVMVRN
jgi:hypothetical protein